MLTTLNNVGSTTLFKAVFINPEQVVRFYACIEPTGRAVARTLIGGGGGGVFIHISCSARPVSFQIDKFEFDFKRN